jgi:hypothetical protein
MTIAQPVAAGDPFGAVEFFFRSVRGVGRAFGCAQRPEGCTAGDHVMQGLSVGLLLAAVGLLVAMAMRRTPGGR